MSKFALCRRFVGSPSLLPPRTGKCSGVFVTNELCHGQFLTSIFTIRFIAGPWSVCTATSTLLATNHFQTLSAHNCPQLSWGEPLLPTDHVNPHRLCPSAPLGLPQLHLQPQLEPRRLCCGKKAMCLDYILWPVTTDPSVRLLSSIPRCSDEVPITHFTAQPNFESCTPTIFHALRRATNIKITNAMNGRYACDAAVVHISRKRAWVAA